MKALNIIQITDFHIGYENEKPYDVDVRGNVIKIVNDLKRHQFDYLVITGDICFRESNDDTYVWIKSLLTEFEGKYIILPGNHDNAKQIGTIFHQDIEINNNELYFSKSLNGHTILFLDSSQGYFSIQQLEWLQNQLNSNYGIITIFMHHPPILAGVPHMDSKWLFHSIDDVQRLFSKSNNQINVFCGHYHIEKTIRNHNCTVYITPSTFFNLSDKTEEFQIDNYLVGWREITINENSIYTSVKYIK